MYENIKTLTVESLSGWNIDDRSDNHYFNSIERLHLLPNDYRYINDNDINNFGILLEKTPNLYALDIHFNHLQVLTNNWTNVSVCNYLSEKIQSIKLYSHQSQRLYFDGDELDQIIRIFSAKCEHLSICILSPMDTVISLLRDMKQLHSLHVLVETKNDVEMTMKWVEKQQIGLNYSNCFIVNYKQNYYFWLGTY